LANDNRPGQNKNLIPNSEYRGYNSDDQTNSSVIEPEAVSNANIAKKSLFIFFKILIINFNDNSSLTNVKYSITEINKTKNTKLQVESEYTSLDEVDSITEINKTKDTKSQVESVSAKRVKRISISDDHTAHNEVEKDTNSHVEPVSAKRVKRLSVSDNHTELVAHNEVEKHILPHRSTRKKRTS